MKRRDRERIDVTMPPPVAAGLRAYARTWHISLSVVVELACAAYLEERAGRVDQAPIRLRFRQRRGPLAKVERHISDATIADLRARGGRRL
ncbi:MAG TPA: hypothetical protein DCP25_03815 [Chloroflexi bacterium]|nr:hypothetical protein [Chloroflexota bacterium]